MTNAMQDAPTSGTLEMTSSWTVNADFLLYSAALIMFVCGLHFNESARESRGRAGFAAALPWLAIFSWCVASILLLHAVALNLGVRMAWYAGLESTLKLASLAALAMGIFRASGRQLRRVSGIWMALAATAWVTMVLYWPVTGVMLAIIAALATVWITTRSRDACWAPAMYLLVPVAVAPWLLTIYRTTIASRSWMQEPWSGDSFPWVGLCIAGIAALWLLGILAAMYCMDRKGGECKRNAFFSAMAVVLVVAGSIAGSWWLGDGFTKDHIREEADELTARVTTAAMAIDYDKAAALRVGDAFEETPDLEEIQRILRELLAANPDLAVCYLWIVENGTLYFLAIEDRGGFSSKLAGTAFRKANAKDIESYERTFPFVFGPFRDDWGVYTAANARIDDSSASGRVVWLGMDFKVETLLRQRAASRLNAKGLGLLCCGALSVAGIFRRRSLREERLHIALEHAADDERARLAMELHDGLGQKLTAITMLGQAAETDEAATRTNDSLTRRISELARDIRRELLLTIRGLGPVELSQGLEAAIRSLIEPLADSGVELKIDLRGHLTHLPRKLQNDLFRIVQEAVNNSLRHGSAKQIQLSLTLRGQQGCLVIEDAPWPAPPAPVLAANDEAQPPTPTAPSPGWGLQTMTRRAHRIGGTLAYGPRPKGGFEVRCTFPT